MEVVIVIVVVLLLWGIMKAINRNTQTQLAAKVTETVISAATTAANQLASVLKPIADKFEQAKADGHVLEWADRYLTTMANLTKQDYSEIYYGLKKHGLGPDPEYQRAIHEESKRRGLPCKYSVDEEDWKTAWNEAPEYPSLDTLHETTTCGDCDLTSEPGDVDLCGADLLKLDLTPYSECPLCGKSTETSCTNKTVPAIMADYEGDVARWKDFAERHPERAAKLEEKAKAAYRRELLSSAQDVDITIKAVKAGLPKPKYTSSRPSTLDREHYRLLLRDRRFSDSRITRVVESLDELCLDEPGELYVDGTKIKGLCAMRRDHDRQHQDIEESIWWVSSPKRP